MYVVIVTTLGVLNLVCLWLFLTTPPWASAPPPRRGFGIALTSIAAGYCLTLGALT